MKKSIKKLFVMGMSTILVGSLFLGCEKEYSKDEIAKLREEIAEEMKEEMKDADLTENEIYDKVEEKIKEKTGEDVDLNNNKNASKETKVQEVEYRCKKCSCLMPNGNSEYCDNCKKNMDTCDFCNKMYDKGFLYEDYMESGTICQTCILKKYCTCDKCGHCSNSVAIFTTLLDNGEKYCDSCLSNSYFNCQMCGDGYTYESFNIVDGLTVCDSCKESRSYSNAYNENNTEPTGYIACSDCGMCDFVLITESQYYESVAEPVCPVCGGQLYFKTN